MHNITTYMAPLTSFLEHINCLPLCIPVGVGEALPICEINDAMPAVTAARRLNDYRGDSWGLYLGRGVGIFLFTTTFRTHDA